jgi:hypothetical protein
VAVGLELLPDYGTRSEHRDVVNTAETPALRPDSGPEAPVPAAPVLAAPDEAQSRPAAPSETEPTFDAAPVVAMTMNMPPPEAPPADVPLDPAAEPPVAVAAPPPVPAVIAPPPVQPKPSLRSRLRDRLSGLGGG